MAVIENELKLLLEEDSYYTLLNEFNASQPVIQKNYYFDTSQWSLHSNHITLRIRLEKDKYILGMKSKLNSFSIYKSSLELEYEISKSKAHSIITDKEPVKNILSKDIMNHLLSLNVDPSDINLIGDIINQRSIIKYLNNNTAELDYSLFSGRHETYELEVEKVTDSMCKEILNLLDDLKINYLINQDSKYERFISSKKRDSY